MFQPRILLIEMGTEQCSKGTEAKCTRKTVEYVKFKTGWGKWLRIAKDSTCLQELEQDVPIIYKVVPDEGVTKEHSRRGLIRFLAQGLLFDMTITGTSSTALPFLCRRESRSIRSLSSEMLASAVASLIYHENATRDVVKAAEARERDVATLDTTKHMMAASCPFIKGFSTRDLQLDHCTTTWRECCTHFVVMGVLLIVVPDVVVCPFYLTDQP